MPKYLVASLLLGGLPVCAQSMSKHGPDCSGSWPTDMAQSTLKGLGVLKNEEIDFAKSKTVRLASERRAKALWHQVYLVTFHKKSGGNLKAIVIHNAFVEKCTMLPVETYLVSTAGTVIELPN